MNLEYIHTTEGRIRAVGSNYYYDYYLKDHLGNTRVVFTDENNDNTPEVLQVDNYYPFGMRHGQANTFSSGGKTTQYMYNGKELQEDFNLDWYNYGARFYDPALGRFMTVDPLAEVMSNITPYHYTYNNPISFIDPTGLIPEGHQDKEWKPSYVGEEPPVYVYEDNGTFYFSSDYIFIDNEYVKRPFDDFEIREISGGKELDSKNEDPKNSGGKEKRKRRSEMSFAERIKYDFNNAKELRYSYKSGDEKTWFENIAYSGFFFYGANFIAMPITNIFESVGLLFEPGIVEEMILNDPNLSNEAKIRMLLERDMNKQIMNNIKK